MSANSTGIPHVIEIEANVAAVRTNRGPLPSDILLGDVDRFSDDMDSPLSPEFPI